MIRTLNYHIQTRKLNGNEVKTNTKRASAESSSKLLVFESLESGKMENIMDRECKHSI